MFKSYFVKMTKPGLCHLIDTTQSPMPAEGWPTIEVFEGDDAEGQARARKADLEALEWKKLAAMGNTLTRYQTNWYITVNEAEVARLCDIDNTDPNKVKITHNVGIVHNANNFTLWSDGKITKHVSDVPAGGKLSPDAVWLISTVRGSDTGYVEGGLESLINVAKVVEKKSLEVGPSRGVYHAEEIEEFVVEWADGSISSLYAHSAGYFEGYQFDLYKSLDSLKSLGSPAPGPEGLIQFPGDEFGYDPELGYVKRED